MSGSGAPTLTADGGGLHVAIVAAQWHTSIMDALVAGAERALADCGVAEVTTVRVPGTFELTVACSRLAHEFDALVALGVVIRGGTPHFEFVCQSAALGITQVSATTGIPIGFGVLTCDTEEQALDRCGRSGSTEDKGYEAALAAVATAVALRHAHHAVR